MENIQLMHGDCLEWLREIPDNSIDLILTDPPYGTTACKWDSVIPFDLLWPELRRVRKERGAVVMTASQPFTTVMIASNIKEFKYCWVWEKSQGVNFAQCNHMPMSVFEDIVVFGEFGLSKNAKIQPTYNPQGVIEVNRKKRPKTSCDHRVSESNHEHVQRYENYPRQVIRFPSDRGLHPTQKPVALMEYLIKTYTNEGETVLDFTMGSGTTGVACVNTGRKFIGIEMDDKYFEIARNRIESSYDQTNQI